MPWGSNFFPLLIITAGSGFTGLFVYSPGPGPGNLISSDTAQAGTDPYGNAYIPGVVVYGVNGQKVALQVTSGAAVLNFFSGAASEVVAANVSTVAFFRGLANEQIATFYSGPETSASPHDQATMITYSSPANAPGTALGFLQYSQASGTPVALVQTTPAGVSSGGANITLTFPANTTPGNCIVVYVQGDSTTGTDPHVSAITIGGVADHFAQGVQALGATDVEIWTDQNLTPGSTTVVVSFTGGTGAQVCSAIAEEWSGVAATAAVDGTATNPSGGPATSFTSTSTSGLALVGEVSCGIVGSESTTFTGPASPWTNNAQVSSGAARMLSGHQILSSISGLAYAGSMTSSVRYSAAILTLKPAASGTGVRLLPLSWGKSGVQAGLVSQLVATVPGSSPATAEAWHNIPLAAGFAAGTPTPQYQLETMNGNRVRLRGQVTLNAAAVAGKTWATLPAGYRATATPQTFDGVNNLSGWSIGSGTFQAGAAGVLTLTPAGANTNVFWVDDCVIVLD